jgi:hypothetical protein
METMKPETDIYKYVNVMIGEPIGAGFGDIDASLTTPESADELGKAVHRNLVRVSKHANGVCIDGRCCGKRMNDEPALVGPSCAGGPALTAYAAAEMTGWFSASDDRSANARFEDILTKLTDGGIGIGAHCDTKAVKNQFKNINTGLPATGCGANDRLLEILDCAANPDNLPAIKKLQAALLDDRYELTADYMKSIPSNWNPKAALDSINHGSDGGSTEILEDSHAEELVVFNYVAGTTVDRDALVAETGRQVFVVDMWYITELAAAMAAGRPDAERMAVQLEHAMVAYQIATYLTLCNGTQRPAFIKGTVPTESPVTEGPLFTNK